MDIINWKDRPYVEVDAMDSYKAIDREAERKYGSVVKAAEISNRDYGYRFQKFEATRKMQPPPSAFMHIVLGFLVVRKLGTSEQYETWMPDHVFEELYARDTSSAV